MRLPFLQLESDLLAHGGPEVASLAGCTLAQVIGHLSLLRAWAVSHAGDDAPPDGWVPGEASGRRIEAAAQWAGERGVLLKALIDAGQVEACEGGHRVMNLEPYAKAWEQNAKAKERMAKARERSANRRVTDGEGSAKFDGQTQTQTQTQKEEASASQGATDAGQQPEGQAALFDEPKPPPPKQRAPRKPSDAELLYQQVQEVRRQQCEKAGVPFTPDYMPEARQNKELGPVVRVPPGAEVDEKGRTEAFRRFTDAFAEYLSDDFHRAKGWPLALFLTGTVRARYEQAAALAAQSTMAEVGT